MSKKKSFIRINRRILAKSVRVVTDDGEQLGVKPIDEALRLAENAGLDLVEVAPNADPPVCKIMDFGKYKYELSKKEKSSKKKQVIINVKEIRLRPKIEEHDYDFKMKHARKFLEAGNKVKATVLFRGRELAHKEFGRKILDRLQEDLSDVAKVERAPLLEGRNMVMFLVKK
ncbi:MAG: translation initiation factor IF-3 [bacterium]